MTQEVEKMYGRMPETVKNSKVLSDNAKKVLAGLLYSYAVSKPAKETGVLCISNSILRKAVGMKNENMLSALRELEMYNLIERNAGMARIEGQKSIASEYIIHFDALKKPIEELSFDDIFGDPKSSETPMGTAITITNTITTSNTISNSNSISNTISNTKTDTKSNTGTTIEPNTTSTTEYTNSDKNLKLEEINLYIKNRLKNIKRKYLSEEDVPELDKEEKELEAYLERYFNIEGVEEIETDMYRSISDLRGSLLCGFELNGGTPEYNVMKPF